MPSSADPSALPPALLGRCWDRLDTRFGDVEQVFPDVLAQAVERLQADQLDPYLDAASRLGKLGRGPEPMLVFLQEWPQLVLTLGTAEVLDAVLALVDRLQQSPNARAIAPCLQTLPAVARRLPAAQPFIDYLELVGALMQRTSVSIHGRQTTHPSPALPVFVEQAPQLLGLLSLDGLRNWVEYGIVSHADHPERQRAYFALQSPDSRAVLQRERHGTLFADVERQLELGLRALWDCTLRLQPYTAAPDQLPPPRPWLDEATVALPDALDARDGVAGVERYRAMLAHIAGHRRWSRPLVADNWSPLQRMAVECLEDCRIDTLVCRLYPGLRPTLLALHPRLAPDACDDSRQACLRHRLGMLSRAILDPRHGYDEPLLLDTVTRFHAALHDSDSSSQAMAELALRFVARSRRPSDQFAEVWFAGSEVDWRDDNRHLWIYIEQGDEEQAFEQRAPARQPDADAELPPTLHPEWDQRAQLERPDWVSVYDKLHPSGAAADIDQLLGKHAALARRLQRLLDLLKPQDKVRIRFQEDGSELDLDVALRALADLRAGAQPDPRINMSHRTDGRDLAVLLLLDLSDSLSDPAPGTGQTILQLSQEAVALLAWAIDRLGDPLAIAGFRSNGRHDVRYLHIKGYGEAWDDTVKARLAGISAGGATRMGAALRHGAHVLGHRASARKLLLVLTDGRPADVDVQDPAQLVHDARRAVADLDSQGIFSYCISLDPGADAYVSDIFGQRYTVIDNIARLPQKLPELFLALTRG